MLLTKPLRVGYVLKRYPRYSETFIVNEILAHEAAGLEIEIFALRPTSDTHFQNLIARVKAPVNYLPGKSIKAIDFWGALEETSGLLPGLFAGLRAARGEEVRDIYQAVLLAREARLKDIDHLHAHFATSATSVARLAARFAEVPYTFTAHAKDIFHESVRHEDLSRKLCDAQAVVTVSDFNLEYLSQNYKSAAKSVKRIYNGLALKYFPFQAPLNRPPLIVAVGRLVEKKGFADLVEACAILAGRRMRFDCRIVGTGPLEMELRKQIERLGLKSRVNLIGPRPQNELVHAIKSASVFAAPCIVGADGNRDGLPTVLLEAMSLGIPCVSTGVTGIPEVIHDGETGLMVPQHDPGALASAIGRLLNDPGLRVRLATNARSLIEKEFDIYRNTAYLRRVFEGSMEKVADANKGVH